MKYSFTRPKINKLTVEYEVPVFDLTVEDDESHCVGDSNMIVHNCTTKLKTGFHSPMFSTVEACCGNIFKLNSDEQIHKLKVLKSQYEYLDSDTKSTKTLYQYIRENVDQTNNFPIIADGGVKHNGDIFKALVAGARMVMVGSMFSACEDSPAENVYNKDGVLVGKQYYGSASEYNKGHKKNVEGTLVQLKCNGMTYQDKLIEITQDLQSSISYSGNTSLKNVENTEYIIVNK